MVENRKRRRWTAGAKLRIVMAGLDGSVEISELCRREGVAIRPGPLRVLEIVP